jgi:hypothetical protein
MALWIVWVAACSSSPAKITCALGTASGGLGNGSSCDCEHKNIGSAATCDEMLAGGASCCSDTSWPASGLCHCVQVTCVSDSTTCHCAVGAGGTTISCALPTGVCCTTGNDCTCYANQTSCGGQTGVAVCSGTTLGCATWPDEPMPVPSCTM